MLQNAPTLQSCHNLQGTTASLLTGHQRNAFLCQRVALHSALCFYACWAGATPPRASSSPQGREPCPAQSLMHRVSLSPAQRRATATWMLPLLQNAVPYSLVLWRRSARRGSACARAAFRPARPGVGAAWMLHPALTGLAVLQAILAQRALATSDGLPPAAMTKPRRCFLQPLNVTSSRSGKLQVPPTAWEQTAFPSKDVCDQPSWQRRPAIETWWARGISGTSS